MRNNGLTLKAEFYLISGASKLVSSKKIRADHAHVNIKVSSWSGKRQSRRKKHKMWTVDWGTSKKTSKRSRTKTNDK